MKLKDQVCSLELAEELKELKIKQKSLWYWNRFTRGKKWRVSDDPLSSIGYGDRYSAFTVAEFGEMLPKGFYSIKYCDTPEYIKDRGNKSLWTGGYINHYWMCSKIHETNRYKQTADTEADARAKMLIYLIENKLIKEENK